MIPVPKQLWDSLEAALNAKARELITDIAVVLRQDKKTLLLAYKAKKKDLYLFETVDPTEDRCECLALISVHEIHTRCRKPVLYGTQRCPQHEFWNPENMSLKPALRRLQTEDSIFFVNDTNDVFDVTYTKKGYLESNTLFIFDIT